MTNNHDLDADKSFDADVIVVGLGSMGSAAADRLSERGQKVLGFEQFHRGHDNGSHHGGSRIIRMSYFEHPDYVPLLRRAFELWDELEHDSHQRGWEQLVHYAGGLYAGPPGCTTVEGSRISAVEHGLDHELLSADDIRARFPHFSVQDDEVAVFEKRAGFVRPELTVALQLARAEERGAVLRHRHKVLNIEPRDGGVAVTVAGAVGKEGKPGTQTYGDPEVFTARSVVICPGAWAPGLFEETGIPQRAERQVMHWFSPGEEFPKYERGPVYIHERADELQIYGFPAADGEEAGAKVAFFRNGRTVDPDQLDREVTDAEIDNMRERLLTFVPALGRGKHRNSRACMYTTTPDEHFVIGRHPRWNDHNIIIACGFSGHGFKFVPVIGEMLADLAIDGRTDHPIELFDPLRFTEVRAAVSEEV
ncbi:N-methyl-L-tryptophan oxidase [Corynebacterium kroppenstedtii]|uniref:N-methyl-L-tryptophan oxidase n=1 Tax=Corynebacterium kroppenstedtii TaxID=161879 RepID=UPI00195A8572|nr:N-methyl-L-tryptophan oxidase [Corynebacterium kroppenstedtii]QRQ64448.1 N-methyl-L-tryptophan oxidase [Corynebacterium kroppenstedtii]